MAKVYELRQLAQTIRNLHGKVRRATARALIRTVTAAERDAKRNAVANFKGTRDRPKTGILANSVFSAYEKGGGKEETIADGFVGVLSRKGDQGTRPYGRQREFGGEIKAKRTKFLWIPLFGPKSRFPGGFDFKDFTPRDFVSGKKSNNAKGIHFWMVAAKSGGGYVAGATVGVKKTTAARRTVARPGQAVGKVSLAKVSVSLKTIPLFALKSRVHQEGKPYVGPAVDKHFPNFPALVNEELAKIDPTPEGRE